MRPSESGQLAVAQRGGCCRPHQCAEPGLDRLGEAGFDPVYGARPLKRAIQQQLENPLAQEILAGRFGSGDTIRVDVAGEGLTFTKSGVVTAA